MDLGMPMKRKLRLQQSLFLLPGCPFSMCSTMVSHLIHRPEKTELSEYELKPLKPKVTHCYPHKVQNGLGLER